MKKRSTQPTLFLLLLITATLTTSLQAQRHGRGYSSSRYYPAIGQRFNSLPGAFLQLSFGGNPYYYSSGSFYRPYGGYYEVAPPPFGIHINVLPFGYFPLHWGGGAYYYFNGIFYNQRNREYDVVEAPLGAEVPSLPGDAKAVIIDGKKFYELNGTYFKEVIKANGELWYKVTGKHRVLTTDRNDISPNNDRAGINRNDNNRNDIPDINRDQINRNYNNRNNIPDNNRDQINRNYNNRNNIPDINSNDITRNTTPDNNIKKDINANIIPDNNKKISLQHPFLITTKKDVNATPIPDNNKKRMSTLHLFLITTKRISTQHPFLITTRTIFQVMISPGRILSETRSAGAILSGAIPPLIPRWPIQCPLLQIIPALLLASCLINYPIIVK